MPKLIQDNRYVQREGLRLESPEAAAGPGMALARAGEAQRSAALRLEDDANVHIQKVRQATAAHAQFAAAARKSEINSLANDAVVRASSEFMTKAQERLAQKTDKNGIPTFSTISSDLAEIGREVGKNYGKIGDKEASAKFGQMFGAFLADRTPGILQEQRAQQVQFAKSALLKTVDSIKALGGNDDITAWPTYERSLTNVLRDGISDGTISALEAYELEKGARSAIVEQGLNKGIWRNPEGLLQHLATGTPEDFGATAEQYNNAIEMSQARILQKRQDAVKAQAQAAKEAKASHEGMLNANLEAHILGYKSGETSNLDDAKEMIFMDESLTPVQRQEYSNKIRSAEITREKEDGNTNDVISMVANGQALAGVPSKAINSAARKMIENATAHKGEPLSPQEEAIVLKGIRGTSSEYVDKLNAVAATGSAEDKAAYAQAYSYLASENYQMVKGLDPKAEAMFTQISRSVSAGMPPEIASEKANELLLNTPEDIRKEWSTAGMKDGKDMAPVILAEAGFDAPIDENSIMQLDVRRKYADNLVIAKGDAGLAHSMTVKQIKTEYGTTSITKAMAAKGEGGWFDVAHPMKNPPEMVSGVDGNQPREMEALQYDLIKTMENAVNIPEGYGVDDLVVTPINLPKSYVGKRKGTQIYGLVIVTDDGHIIEPRDSLGKEVQWEVYPGLHGEILVEIEKQKAMQDKGNK